MHGKSWNVLWAQSVMWLPGGWEAGDISLHSDVQTVCGAHLDPDPMSTIDSTSGRKAAAAWNWPLAPIQFRGIWRLKLYLPNHLRPQSIHGTTAGQIYFSTSSIFLLFPTLIFFLLEAGFISSRICYNSWLFRSPDSSTAYYIISFLVKPMQQIRVVNKLTKYDLWPCQPIKVSAFIFISLHKLWSRSRWPRGLRNEPSSPARIPGSWVRIPLKAWMSVGVYSVFVSSCIGVGLATDWSPVPVALLTVLSLRNWSETKRFSDALCTNIGAT
jgi:hypothetical protein